MLPIFQLMLHGMIYCFPQQPEAHASQEMSPFERSLAMGALVSVPVFMNLLTVYLLLAYLRVRITINEAHLISQGVFLRRCIPLAEITQVVWPCPRRRPAILVVQGLRSRVKIGFYELTESFPGQCVQQLRDAFPIKVQIGWQEFQKEHDAPPRRAPRIRWLALVSAFLYLLVPGLGIWLLVRIAPEYPALSLFGPTELDGERQKLVQVFGFFAGVCAICCVLAGVYVYRYFTFRETVVVTK